MTACTMYIVHITNFCLYLLGVLTKLNIFCKNDRFDWKKSIVTMKRAFATKVLPLTQSPTIYVGHTQDADFIIVHLGSGGATFDIYWFLDLCDVKLASEYSERLISKLIANFEAMSAFVKPQN